MLDVGLSSFTLRRGGWGESREELTVGVPGEPVTTVTRGTVALVTVIASVTDPDGRVVELTAERWAHILDGHPEMPTLQAELLRAVQAPDERPAAERPGESWYYLGNVGPSRWLKVVVVFEGERGFIVTAHPRREIP